MFEYRPPPFLHTVLATMRLSGFWYARPRTSAGEGAACRLRPSRLSRWPRRNAPTRSRADPCLWDRCRCIGFYPRPFLKSVFFLCYGPDGHADGLRALCGLLWPRMRRFEQRPVPLGPIGPDCGSAPSVGLWLPLTAHGAGSPRLSKKRPPRTSAQFTRVDFHNRCSHAIGEFQS